MPFTKTLRITSAVTLSLLTSVSIFAAPRGKADFTRYVALGDSLTAGVVNYSLVLTHQQFSVPAVIARQTHAGDFQQPLVSEPGIAAELELKSLFPSPVIAPKASTNGGPINLSLTRPYNNLAVPGANLKELLTLTGREAVTGTSTTFAQFILRGLGTAVDQAIALKPTFITVWIGNNDVLGAVQDGTPASLTPLADFTTNYNLLLDKLVAGAPTAGIAVAGVPDPTVIPYATTIPAVLINPATSQPVLGPDGNPIPLFGVGDGKTGALPFGTFVTLDGALLLRSGFGIPPQIAGNFPQLPNAGKPLPDSATITPTEIRAISTRASEITAAIKQAAAVRGIVYVDTPNALLDLKTNGLNFGGVQLSTKFITGGLFSLDGYHPSDIGYTVIANEFLKTINKLYRKHYPLASFTDFYVNNAALIGKDPLVSTNVLEFHAPANLSMFGMQLRPAKRHAAR